MLTKLPLKTRIVLVLLFGTVLAGLTACRTLEYRQVQSQFQEAVQADNSGSPLTRQHEDVVDRLTPEYIARLDPKLRPNAWMLRAVSAWRAGFTNDLAEKSAEKGLADTNLVAGSRDHVVLTMIPALVVDSDLLRRWLAADRNLSQEVYTNTFEKGFQAAWDELEKVPPLMNERTPVDARAYFHYHRWRILQNWLSVIGRLKPPAFASAANQSAAGIVGNSSGGLLGAANQEADQVPEGHPLRALIRAKGGQ